jgi:hypothetical protein
MFLKASDRRHDKAFYKLGQIARKESFSEMAYGNLKRLRDGAFRKYCHVWISLEGRKDVESSHAVA